MPRLSRFTLIAKEPTGRANARPMTGSATKQSILPLRGEMDCFASLAMTWKILCLRKFHVSAISRRLSPEVLQERSPREIRGRRECRARNAPAASCVIKVNTRAYRFSGGNPAFPAQWFYGLLRALPGDQACLTPSSALLIADLTPASGRRNHTTWRYASGRARLARCRVHRIPPRVDDVAQRPSEGTGQANQWSDLGPLASEIF